jgi:hypothetical protein
MPAFGVQAIMTLVVASIVGPMLGSQAVRGLRCGQIGSRKLCVTRGENPVLFWTYIVMYGAMAVTLGAFGLFVVVGALGVLSELSVIALFVAIFCLGIGLAAIAGLRGYYVVAGFHSGTAVLIERTSVRISARAKHPVWYWFTQVSNIVVTAVLGAFGLGAIIGAFWLVCGAPALW